MRLSSLRCWISGTCREKPMSRGDLGLALFGMLLGAGVMLCLEFCW